MAYKDPEKRRAYHREWYRRNKRSQIERTRAHREKIRVIVRKGKERPCSDCGVQYPHYVMQYDHVNGDKKFTIADLGSTGKQKVLAEIDKCDVVCANCHAIRTYERRAVANGRALVS